MTVVTPGSWPISHDPGAEHALALSRHMPGGCNTVKPVKVQ
jgi:hypothetical protein